MIHVHGKWFFVVDKLCKRDSGCHSMRKKKKRWNKMKIWTEKQLTKENTRIEYTKHDCVFLAIISVFFSLRNMDVYVKWFLYLGRLCGKYAKCWDRNQWQSWFLCYKWMNAMGSIPGVLECLALVRRIQRWYKFLSLRLFVFHSKPQDGWSAREMALPIHRIKFLSIFFFAVISVKCLRDFSH